MEPQVIPRRAMRRTTIKQAVKHLTGKKIHRKAKVPSYRAVAARMSRLKPA